jgi:hypothetical protein
VAAALFNKSVAAATNQKRQTGERSDVIGKASSTLPTPLPVDDLSLSRRRATCDRDHIVRSGVGVCSVHGSGRHDPRQALRLEDGDMSEELLEMIPLLAVLIEAAAFGWAFVRRNVSGIVLVNAVGAAGVILLVAPELKISLQFVDVFLLLQLAILAFALTTLTTSLSWFVQPVGRPLAVWTEFSILVGLSIALAVFLAILRLAHLA